MLIDGYTGGWAGAGYSSFYWDTATNYIWFASGPGIGVAVKDSIGTFWTNIPGIGSLGAQGSYIYYYSTNTDGHFTLGGAAYAIEYAPTSNLFFLVTRSTDLLTMSKANPNGGFTLKSLAASRPNAKPRNIKYVSYKDKLYIPTMQDNAVIEVDTFGNVTHVFTGFDIPWNIVDTGSKVFAVQLGSQGLRLVTT